jgi:predicted oxidoreductase
LQVDYIDTYMIARPHYGMNFEGMAEAFAQLKKQGKIKRVGVVSFNGQQIRSLNKFIKVDEVQLELSLTHIESLQDSTVDVCQELGIDIFSWSPIGGGAIFTNTRSGRKLEERLAAVAQKNDWTLTEMALLFLSHIPANVRPIINQHKIDKYIEAVNTMSLSISNEQWFEILQASTGQEFS